MSSIFFLNGEEISIRIVTNENTLDVFNGPLYTEDGGFNWNAKKIGSLELSEQDITDLIGRLELMLPYDTRNMV
mgnify:FL=1|tara:strand:+ start:73 stop:294 length:222 start_codon:yes stop_codon:yes gene_type:complete